MSGRPSLRTIGTPRGPARAHVHRPGPREATAGTLVLGHGAGGTSFGADLLALTALTDAGWHVVLVEQPWRVAGRRVAAPPPHLDEAWLPVVRSLRTGRGALPGPLVLGGRSAGARVACRCAAAQRPAAVLALAFPLVPPGKDARAGRAHELAAASQTAPVLVVQGESDPFGGPGAVSALGLPGVEVRAVAGGHSFRAPCADVLAQVREWLATCPWTC